VEGESILLDLDIEGVAASSGSACSSESSAPSPVLEAMCIPPEQSRGAIRFSLGHDNTVEDVDYVLEVFPRIIERLRSLSPLYRKKKTM
jgi:cysteine desulfurase